MNSTLLTVVWMFTCIHYILLLQLHENVSYKKESLKSFIVEILN